LAAVAATILAAATLVACSSSGSGGAASTSSAGAPASSGNGSGATSAGSSTGGGASGSAGGSATGTATSGGSAGPSDTASPAGSGSTCTKAGSGSIAVDYQNTGTYDKAAAAIKPTFEQCSGVTVNIFTYPNATLAANNTNAAISGKCTYNVMSGSNYLAAIYPQFENLDDLAAKSSYPSQLIPGLWEHSEFYNGHHVGIPYGPDAFAPMYRTDLFQQAGLTPPTTWDELLTDLPILKDKFSGQGIVPITFGAGAVGQLWHLLFLNYNGYVINNQGKYALDPAGAATALEYAMKLLSYGPQNVTGVSEEAAQAAFASGKAAILLDWPSFMQVSGNAATSPIKGKWAVLPDPAGSIVSISLWQMYMPSCTANKDAAWQWMTTYSSPATDKMLFEKYGVNPAFEATYQDPTLAQQYSNYLPATKQNLARAVNIPVTTQAKTAMGQGVSDALTGKLSAAQAIAEINSSFAKIAVPSVLVDQAKQLGLAQK
jgi:ABC-type glycerol-3-phosphate transport system substrate-binding protein